MASRKGCMIDHYLLCHNGKNKDVAACPLVCREHFNFFNVGTSVALKKHFKILSILNNSNLIDSWAKWQSQVKNVIADWQEKTWKIQGKIWKLFTFQKYENNRETSRLKTVESLENWQFFKTIQSIQCMQWREVYLVEIVFCNVTVGWWKYLIILYLSY